MATTVTKDDVLPHIQYEEAHPSQPFAAQSQSVAERVASPNGQITIVSAFGCSLILKYTFSSSGVEVSVVLDTPFGSATLGNATINPSNPSITIGGSKGGFKAEATISFNFSTMVLSFSASVCAPFLGCKSASGSLHL